MNNVFNRIEETLINLGFKFERKDLERPWGGFWVIDDAQTSKFVEKYFPSYSLEELTKGAKVSCKILLVAPQSRLSWQYHYRRSEIWRVTEGTVGVVKSKTDEETPMNTYNVGDVIVLEKEERHRLVGLDEYGVVAEIWQHTDSDNPSNENDIVRLQDDYRNITVLK